MMRLVNIGKLLLVADNFPMAPSPTVANACALFKLASASNATIAPSEFSMNGVVFSGLHHRQRLRRPSHWNSHPLLDFVHNTHRHLISCVF